ncbi:hypothetical protein [Paenibacillus sp. GCM10023250]|uniref:hypothetical protein n=1 Tax=Paenibacillus sp. GCM10023250 TaxID=3252648 RepID=UPI00360A1EB0
MLCPVCNGLEQLAVRCPACASAVDDWGRTADFMGPYSPYQPDDADPVTEMTVEEPMRAVQSCSHVAYCRQCGAAFEAAVRQWS